MSATRRGACVLALVLLARPASAQQPQRLTDTTVSPGVFGVLATPAITGRHPAIVLIPGSAGWRPAYAQLAQLFADSGFVTLAIDYYPETGRDSSRADKLRMWPVWQATIRNAIHYLQQLPMVSPQRVALVGYSRGASLAVSAARTEPAVRAVVDYYGAGGAGPDSLYVEVRDFPPLLILHGDADSLVPVQAAYDLRDRVLAHGGEVELHIYPGAQHGFNAPWAAYSPAAAQDAWRRTMVFLRKQLGN